MELFVALLVFVAVLIVGAWILSGMAKTQKDLALRASPDEIVETIRSHFSGVWWTSVPGAGQLNFRARGLGLGAILKKKPVLSVDVDQTADGSFLVQVWMSEWGQGSGVVGLADRVVLKRNSLFRKLRTLEAAAISN